MVNRDYTICFEKTIKGQLYRVIASQSNGKIQETLDTIRNLNNGKEFTKKRSEWKKIFDKHGG